MDNAKAALESQFNIFKVDQSADMFLVFDEQCEKVAVQLSGHSSQPQFARSEFDEQVIGLGRWLGPVRLQRALDPYSLNRPSELKPGEIFFKDGLWRMTIASDGASQSVVLPFEEDNEGSPHYWECDYWYLYIGDPKYPTRLFSRPSRGASA